MKGKTKYNFPNDFLIGAGTSSYQIEGAWKEDGKGESVWDKLTHTIPEAVENKDNGNIACDSYHKYKEDVQILKDIGAKDRKCAISWRVQSLLDEPKASPAFVRAMNTLSILVLFSLSWTRILPNGDLSNINKKGIDYYHNLIEELLNNEIEPMVTLYHWDLPQTLQEIGGWLNPLIVDYFEDYARLVYGLYGDRVKWWCTINEPLEIVHGYSTQRYAPYLALHAFGADYLAGHNLLKAHARAYHVYDKEFRYQQNGKISFTLSGLFSLPKTNCQEDVDAAERANEFDIGWFGHPVYSKTGDYPPIMRKLVDKKSFEEGRSRSRLPTFTKAEIEEIRGTYDYLTMNHYTSKLCTPGMNPEEETRYQDANIISYQDKNWPQSYMVWLKVVPHGFRQMFRWLKLQYDNPPVFITESGYCDSGEINDLKRINYYKDYITEMLNAIYEDECNVIGYIFWSLLDNFEWLYGYGYKFGIVQVDFEDPERKRTPKLSAKFIQDLIRCNSVPH